MLKAYCASLILLCYTVSVKENVSPANSLKNLLNTSYQINYRPEKVWPPHPLYLEQICFGRHCALHLSILSWPPLMQCLCLSSFILLVAFHWNGPLGHFSLRVAMSVCVSVCLRHWMQFFLGLSSGLRSHDQFPGLLLVHGRSASTIELKRRIRQI